MLAHPNTVGAPTKKTKNVVFAQFGPFFGKIFGKPPFSGRDTIAFLSRNLIIGHRTAIVSVFFEKHPSGRDTVCGPSSNFDKKRLFWSKFGDCCLECPHCHKIAK